MQRALMWLNVCGRKAVRHKLKNSQKTKNAFLACFRALRYYLNYLKGQLISECLFEKIVWTKIPTKNLIDSAQQV